MAIDIKALHSLSQAEKLELVEILWDDIGASDARIPLPKWVDQTVSQRRKEMRDPSVGLSHEEAWRRIDGRRSTDRPGTIR